MPVSLSRRYSIFDTRSHRQPGRRYQMLIGTGRSYSECESDARRSWYGPSLRWQGYVLRKMDKTQPPVQGHTHRIKFATTQA